MKHADKIALDTFLASYPKEADSVEHVVYKIHQHGLECGLFILQRHINYEISEDDLILKMKILRDQIEETKRFRNIFK